MGLLSFVLAGYVDYEYSPDYLDAPSSTRELMILILDLSTSQKVQTWLVDQLSTINTSFHELPKPENEAEMVIKIF
jgi:hypothetical protein